MSRIFNTFSASSKGRVPTWRWPYPCQKPNSLRRENLKGWLRCFLCPHSDQRHAFSALSSGEVAWLLAHPYYSFLRTQPHLTNSTLSGIECFGGQLIVSTPPAAALFTGRPRYRPFPLSATTAVGQLPSGWSAPFRSSILPQLGYPNLCPPGVTGVPYREVNSKVATAPKLKVEDKDRVNNSRRIKTVKLNIVKLKALLN